MNTSENNFVAIKFPSIKALSAKDKKDFEIIDDKYLSFLQIDEVFSIEELIGLDKTA